MILNELYPLKFIPILKERIWGGQKLNELLGKELSGVANVGESWEISCVDESVSVVANGNYRGNSLKQLLESHGEQILGSRIFRQFGTEFPLLIKFLDAREDLSIQVHPDDKLARERHGSNGKTEMWYVLQADEGSGLVCGFKNGITKSMYLSALENNSVETLLARHPVKEGDIFFIPAGMVHAIGAGIVIAEIQQTSDVTYRIYDFNRLDSNGKGRELHTELALDAIDFKSKGNHKEDYIPTPNQPVAVVKSSYFQTNVVEASVAITRDYGVLQSFVIIVCVGGRGKIKYGNADELHLQSGETVLIPACLNMVTITPERDMKWLETFVPG